MEIAGRKVFEKAQADVQATLYELIDLITCAHKLILKQPVFLSMANTNAVVNPGGIADKTNHIVLIVHYNVSWAERL
ncbi:MAG: hypothetical protein ABI691_02940 [Ginsengibacter sp.]